MQVIGNAKLRSENFNGVSDKLKAELIKPVKPGEHVYFQLLNGSYDVQLKRDVFGASKSIPLKDRIYDPYAINDEGKEVGAYVEIGVPEDIVGGRVERCKKFWVESIANGIPGNGEFNFTGGNIREMEIYEFLCLSNKSNENPHRDKSKEPSYKRVDPEAERKNEDEKNYRETVAKLKRYSKDPDKAKELQELLGAKTKEKETAPA